MRRREFITLFGGAAAAWPLTARAAGPAHIGFVSSLNPSAASDFLDALRDGLAAHGYSEPGTLKISPVFADNVLERVPALVEELERRRVNVIVTHAAATTSVVKGYRTIPAVYEFSADPVTLGIAVDLAHPLFNATGVTLMLAELNSKRLEVLREIEPNIRRIAVIANPLHPGSEFERKDSETKARQLGMEISFFPTPNREELDRALGAIEASPLQAMLLFSDAFVVEHRKQIIDFAMRRGMPIISGWAVIADSGALCTYGPRLVESYRRVAYFVDRILKGAKPSELPIEQPTVLEFVVNLRSAKALGITIPPAVLARADRVIE
jgi:putative tryptophan/tyrosine transport system substrate-binding protein